MRVVVASRSDRDRVIVQRFCLTLHNDAAAIAVRRRNSSDCARVARTTRTPKWCAHGARDARKMRTAVAADSDRNR
eukprot:8375959-Lingulodinium_polyedra.AAC.1